MIQEIIYRNEQFVEWIAYLKSISPTYPKVHFNRRGDELYATTLVEFVYNGVVFKRHHVESLFYPNHMGLQEKLQERIGRQAELTINQAIPCRMDDVVGIKSTTT